MVSKRWLFGAFVAMALAAPVSAANIGNSGWDFLAPADGYGDVPLDVTLAKNMTDLGGPPSPAQAATGPSDQLALATALPEAVPVHKRVAHVIPVVNVEQVANSPLTAFRSNRFWVIGSYR